MVLAALLCSLVLFAVAILGWALIASSHDTAVSRWRERRDVRRSATRAAQVAEALGLRAEQDPQVPTIWCLRAAGDALDATLRMGSVSAYGRLTKVDDWMEVRASGPVGLAAGVKVRPPRRTVWEWRDGDPGEPPSLVTPGGVPLVIEPGNDGAEVDTRSLTAWVDALPAGTWLVALSRDHIELRAGAPAAEDPVRCARWLLDRARATPF
ncbi:uncharacterized protein SOCE26_058550 [Sorangium cellulosum]|uniref:Uncharacterized protein n=1 Tax=Sorangium cellulosum TaxID=56 RepID=A0A2L0EYJ8_SORCE|nr:hypothetical protein [Sorangium cellulosum]AUX44391.1 uncharacterized protein SOCE26_058550 [Sorangium cellulosum]